MESRERRIDETDQQEQKDSGSIGADTTNLRPSHDQLVFEILKYPNKLLYKKSIEVEQWEVDDSFKKLIETLKNTLLAEGGVGIAAPQVGWHRRIIIVLDKDFLEGNSKEPTVLLNPTLHDLSGEQDSIEACLSVFMPSAVVKRAADCVVRGRDLNWNEVEFYTEGLEAAVFQHECDHLDGKLYIDRISRLKKDILIRKWKKKQRQIKHYGTHYSRLQTR